MKKQKLIVPFISLFHFGVNAQNTQSQDTKHHPLYFVSDTQQSMLVEKIILKSNRNKEATADIFSTILKEMPKNLYMLGDVVALGYATHKWKKVDLFLESCRSQGTIVCGVLGNHEVMGRQKKGERNFQKRFPMNVKTGYVFVTDSVAVVLLNSNFNTYLRRIIKSRSNGIRLL